MKKDNHKTDVIFYFERDSNIDVFAYFINEWHSEMLKTCYAHIGQHSACSIDYIKDCIKCDKPEQYSDLQKELEGLGYNLNVLNL